MTLPLERARARRPVTWLTLLGVLLLPVLIGGILVTALDNPTTRLDRMSAAIVNQDAPVTIDGKVVPLGRQLSAGLVKGSSDVPSNLDWTISNPADAASGLADGTYQAVVTIPKDFSAAATSAGAALQGGSATPTKATISVKTAKDALTLDSAITAQVTQTAASVMGATLSASTLQNVFIGYSTLGDKLGEAASGAASLASGAHSAADGAAQLPSGATQLGTGASSLGSGASQLASGLDTIAANTRGAASGASQLAGAVTRVSQSLTSATQLTDAAAAASRSATAAAGDTAAVAQDVGALLQQHCGTTPPADPALCRSLDALLGTAKTAATDAGTAAAYATGTQSGLGSLISGASSGLDTIAANTGALSSGLTRLADGTTQSAAGARQLAGGSAQLASGADQLASGAQSLSDGVAQLASGTDSLAAGLKTAAASVPVYTDARAKSLATVLADPVTAKGVGSDLFGASAIPLLAALALWFGGLGSFIALQAVSRRALASRRPSALLALRSLAPAAVIGAVQGILVAAVVQIVASYDVGTWFVFAGVCVAAGVAFAAVNQALVAVFGGAGRWLAALVGVLAVATGVVSTVPGAMSAVAGVMPTAPAYDGMLAALTSGGGVGAGIAGLLSWGVVALIASTLAVARRRTVSARALLRRAPLPA